MNNNNRMYTELSEDSNRLTLDELRAKVAEAEKIVKRLGEEELKLQQEVKSRDTKPAFQNDNDLFLSYAKDDAEETAAFIQENAERKIKDMVREVKELKAKYDKESSELQERIDVKKHYIVTMFESLMVYLEDGSPKQNENTWIQNGKNDQAQMGSEKANADSELQSLLKQFM